MEGVGIHLPRAHICGCALPSVSGGLSVSPPVITEVALGHLCLWPPRVSGCQSHSCCAASTQCLGAPDEATGEEEAAQWTSLGCLVLVLALHCQLGEPQ